MVFHRRAAEVQSGARPGIVPRHPDGSVNWNLVSPFQQEEMGKLARFCIEQSGLSYSWSGAGRGFADSPSCRIYARTVVVRQFGGLDI